VDKHGGARPAPLGAGPEAAIHFSPASLSLFNDTETGFREVISIRSPSAYLPRPRIEIAGPQGVQASSIGRLHKFRSGPNVHRRAHQRH
jgi:hypothetical protein